LQLLANDEDDLAQMLILQDIVDDDERAGQVIQHLRGLLRKGEIQAQVIDLNSVVRQVLISPEKRHYFAQRIIETSLEPRKHLVLADRVQIQQCCSIL